jgi:dTDP-glucose 4,6-dehydratase
MIRGDIAEPANVSAAIAAAKPRYIVNFAAETHVDRSIAGAADFVRTNLAGTHVMLAAALDYWSGLTAEDRARFVFLHVSTDEVFGSLAPEDPAFDEDTPYRPNNPYSATKAGSDHLVRAYAHTYGLPAIITNCSNNYGPYQFPEKFIPRIILRALKGEDIPVFGDGGQVRDWLYVEDHCRAIALALARGRAGETYAVGGGNEVRNIDTAHLVCDLLNRMKPRSDGGSYRSQIRFVTDRLGHDRRYAINAAKVGRELGWQPQESFASGLERTVAWYLANTAWLTDIETGAYRYL